MSAIISFVREVQYLVANEIPPALGVPLLIFLAIAVRGLMVHWNDRSA
jgi:hypothetical protein